MALWPYGRDGMSGERVGVVLFARPGAPRLCRAPLPHTSGELERRSTAPDTSAISSEQGQRGWGAEVQCWRRAGSLTYD